MQQWDLSAANAAFLGRLADILCDEGYRHTNGTFRKNRRERLFILEAQLICEQREGETVLLPQVRIADAAVRKQKDGTLTAGGRALDDATVESVRAGDEKAFYKTLRHLKSVPLPQDALLSDEALTLLAREAALGASVCENRAIPAEYRRRCKNDFPFGRAFSIAFWSALLIFALVALSVGLLVGLAIYMSEGFGRFYGLFMQPYLYLFAAAVAAIYGFFVFRKIRSGRF